ncbi:hypothetical protein BGZ67_006140 [Mortierella alpina]|nr:hypothetical protein BGZ67_006140 [Mortierella alpina]
MFATNPSASAADADNASWMDGSHGMLLSHQDVLDYTSFSDDSHSPVLSLQSFSSQQHSPDMDAFNFHDFEPLSASPSASASAGQGHAFQDLFRSASDPTSSAMDITPSAKASANETARQAALLHAYLAAQNQAYNDQLQQQQQQQKWNFAAMAQLQKEDSQQKEKDQKLQEENKEVQQQQEQLEKTRQADAQNLARYLAQIQQVKRESPQPEEMDKADDGSDSCNAPSSPSSTSSVMAERSPSPEVSQESSCTVKISNGAKPSRQLICFNCNVTQTPLWRRTPDRQHSLCNACGLYYKQYGAHRPLNVRHKLPSVLPDVRLGSMPYARSTQGTRGSSPESSTSSDSDSDSGRVAAGVHSLPDLTKLYSEALLRPPAHKTTPPLMTAKQGIECVNCSQTQTPLWRKNEAGEPICNACGLYAKLHNRARPVTMRKAKITRRRRDWGGNLAHQAQAQAQALAFVHAQVQAQVQAQAQQQIKTGTSTTASSVEQTPVHSSDSEGEQPQSPRQSQQVPRPQSQQPSASVASGVAQKLSGNLIMDEHKFSDMVGQMNAHQMNRFLSILESRCGVLRNRLLASTEASAQSSLDHLF